MPTPTGPTGLGTKSLCLVAHTVESARRTTSENSPRRADFINSLQKSNTNRAAELVSRVSSLPNSGNSVMGSEILAPGVDNLGEGDENDPYRLRPAARPLPTEFGVTTLPQLPGSYSSALRAAFQALSGANSPAAQQAVPQLTEIIGVLTGLLQQLLTYRTAPQPPSRAIQLSDTSSSGMIRDMKAQAAGIAGQMPVGCVPVTCLPSPGELPSMQEPTPESARDPVEGYYKLVRQVEYPH
ncbi:hypothetical protein [Nocardia terpenica]|uniref:hypothetical protein n=1 Tax=Nocardia terpenica TaxID=455432 RepID=UPI0012FD29DD|nr:hypothetical protein [Nocardia terpenica]